MPVGCFVEFSQFVFDVFMVKLELWVLGNINSLVHCLFQLAVCLGNNSIDLFVYFNIYFIAANTPLCAIH